MKFIQEFENNISDYFGSPYGVAVDCCTHGIELCLRMLKITQASCPKHTYLSVPMTFIKLNINWNFTDEKWFKYYKIGDTIIYDAAVLWEPHSYIPKSLMVLSFQFKKHLGLGRGGMILTDNIDYLCELKKLRYDGRTDDIPWVEQDIETMGYHYYMTPETAEKGLKDFHYKKNLESRIWSYQDYPDISKMKIFKEKI